MNNRFIAIVAETECGKRAYGVLGPAQVGVTESLEGQVNILEHRHGLLRLLVLAGIAQAAIVIVNIAMNADFSAAKRDFVDKFGVSAQHNRWNKKGRIATILANGRQDGE